MHAHEPRPVIPRPIEDTRHKAIMVTLSLLQIGLVLVAACLLAVRAAVGCVALYPQRKYLKWWDNDKCAFALLRVL